MPSSTLCTAKDDRYLGLEIQKQLDGSVKLSQQVYTKEILHEFQDLIRQSNTPIAQRAQEQCDGLLVR